MFAKVGLPHVVRPRIKVFGEGGLRVFNHFLEQTLRHVGVVKIVLAYAGGLDSSAAGKPVVADILHAEELPVHLHDEFVDARLHVL